MNKISILMVFAFMLSACDTDQIQRPKTESRTMIIGGVPVNDHDYTLPKSKDGFSNTTTIQSQQ